MIKITKFFFASMLVVFSFATSLAFAGETLSEGQFKGDNDHITTGSVMVIKTMDGYKVVLEDNFSLDGAPDPKLAFGHNGVDKSTLFSPLKKNTGKQVYQLPADLDPTQFNEIYVWCEKFDVSLGKANLKAM